MWRAGCRLGQHAAILARRGASASSSGASCPSVALRRFCAGAQPVEPLERVPKRPSAKRRGGAGVGQVAGVCVVAGAGAYAASSDVRDQVNEIAGSIGDIFEDFNDVTREFFEGIGDKFVSKRQEPWLLELSTMKYPENIPTLVLDLDKVILHLEHDSRQGWHVIKRPFADQFFKEISHYYEVVIFSDDVFPVALDIATKWNLPVTGVLHRDFCKKKRNSYVKDLSKLGRKLDKVILIDHDPAAFSLQPENGVLIKPFEGDTADSELADLLEFLKAAATAATANTDVRQFVGKYGGGDYDVGRRYLVYKGEQDKLVEQRRSMGRVLAPGRGFPSAPQSSAFGQFPR